MKTTCLIIWMFLSFLLVLSVIGLFLFIPKDHWERHESTPSTWSTIGLKLLNSVIEK